MNWRDIGDTDRGSFRRILRGSPLEEEADAIYAAIRPHTRLGYAQARIESELGQSHLARQWHNFLGQRPRPGDTSNVVQVVSGPFKRFDSFADCARYYIGKLTDPTYAYAGTTTLQEFVHVYAPASDNNDEAAYVARVQRYIRDLPKTGEQPMPGVQIAGLATPIDLDVPVEVRLIPIGQTNQRTGIPMHPDRWIQHETGNTRAGADARAERAYLANGAPDQFGRPQKLSFHFAVDDLRIVQCIPVDEVAWHGGDGTGPCNSRGIASELCVGSTVNWAKARTNGEKLAAAVTEAMSIPVEAIRQHNACSGKDCPHYMRAEGYWPRFVANVQRFREGTVPPKWAKAVKPTLPVRPHIDGNGAFWLPLKQTRWVALESAKRHQWAFEDSAEVGPPITPADGPVTFVYSVAVPDQGVWFVSKAGSRVRADAFVPETV